MVGQVSPGYEELVAQIEALGEGETGEILDDGVIRAMTRPAGLHRMVARRIWLHLSRLDRVAAPEGTWWIEPEPVVELERRRRFVPDLAGWRTARVPTFIHEAVVRVPPDWVCEVMSPSTRAVDRLKKLPQYLAMGVEHVWLVDPESRTLEVWSGGASPVLVSAWLEGGPDEIALAPFDLPLAPVALFDVPA